MIDVDGKKNAYDTTNSPKMKKIKKQTTHKKPGDYIGNSCEYTQTD